MAKTINTDEPIIRVLVNIHNRLAEISKFLEVCTAKFAHIDATDMTHSIKFNAPTLDSANGDLYSSHWLANPTEYTENHSVGYDKTHGLHEQPEYDGEYYPLARDDEDSRTLAIDENGYFIYPSQQEADNDH